MAGVFCPIRFALKFTLSDLFAFASEKPAPGNRNTAFETISEFVVTRMTAPKVENLDEVGHPTGVTVSSREYQILHERGLKIISASVTNLLFPTLVEDTLVEQWKATLLARTQHEPDYNELVCLIQDVPINKSSGQVGENTHAAEIKRDLLPGPPGKALHRQRHPQNKQANISSRAGCNHQVSLSVDI